MTPRLYRPRGYFAIGIENPKIEHNIGTLWRSAHAFGASFVFTVGRRYAYQSSDTTKATRHVPLFHFPTLDDLLAHLPDGCALVGVEIHPGAVLLPAFAHPTRACYLLGAEDRGLSPAALAACHSIVEIPGAAYCLNVAVAGSIVLYDRVVKTGQAEVVKARRAA